MIRGRTEGRGIWCKISNQCSSQGVIINISDYKTLYVDEIHPWHNTENIIKAGKVKVSYIEEDIIKGV